MARDITGAFTVIFKVQGGKEVFIICNSLYHLTGPDSVMVRAFASEAGGAGSNPGRVIPKTLKMVPVATLLGAQH